MTYFLRALAFIAATVTSVAAEARPYVAAGQARPYLDGRVAKFLSDGAETLPVILVYRARPRIAASEPRGLVETNLRSETTKFERQLFGSPQMKGAVVRRSFWSLRGSSTSLTRKQLKFLASSELVAQILDAEKPIRLKLSKGSGSLQSSAKPPLYTDALKRIRVNDLKTKFPHIDGTGVRVGILDTGIDDKHPDLAGKLSLYKDFSPANDPVPSDGFGHGTHVAGTIAGGAASGTVIGVASNVTLVVGRIFDGNASSTREGILAAMQWIADPDGDPTTDDQPHVVNNSWGDDDPYVGRDFSLEPFCQIVDSWVALGIVPIFSAGNTGPSYGTINLPAGCPNAIAVGATEPYDRSPWFSSGGPAHWKSGDIVKPEVVAPGVDIYSAEPRGQYQKMTGTSMAAPHATGLVALILQANPKFTVAETSKALIDGVVDLGDPGKDNTFGWGRIDALGSVR